MQQLSCSQVGELAESTVVLDFARRGLCARPTPFPSAPHDLLADLGSVGVLRIQVKGTRRPCQRAFGSREINGRRSDPGLKVRYVFLSGSEQGFIKYEGLVDLFAFVALDISEVFYLPPSEIGTHAKTWYPDDFSSGARGSLDRFLFNWMFS